MLDWQFRQQSALDLFARPEIVATITHSTDVKSWSSGHGGFKLLSVRPKDTWAHTNLGFLQTTG